MGFVHGQKIAADVLRWKTPQKTQLSIFKRHEKSKKVIKDILEIAIFAEQKLLKARLPEQAVQSDEPQFDG